MVEGVRCSVASNINTPVPVLEKLAFPLKRWFSKAKDSNVIARVAGNANTPASVLEKLAEDEDEDVRKAVTENPNFTS